jgi:predicted anti-sigma-YlaC factor YlaD
MTGRSGPHFVVRGVLLVSALICLTGCSMIKTAAIKNVSGTLSCGGDTFASDNDPELVRGAVPFALKMYESLLESVPKYEPLLISTCSTFTQYAFAFVETDADVLGEDHHDEAKALRERAVKLYVRGKDYCLRALNARFHGIEQQLQRNPEAALKEAGKKDVPLLYWAAASWGAALSLSMRPDLTIDFPIVRALIERALALDESWGNGSLHETMITIESLGEALGGSEARAREHFKRAVELQKGSSAGPYVALATGIAVAKQDRVEFEKLLNEAIAVDPDKTPALRLQNLITQRRARALLARIDTLFAR